MGEAQRKLSADCPCGSGKPAKDCCYLRRYRLGLSAEISLTRSGRLFSHLDCYLRAAGGCSDRISGEHPLSRAVLATMNAAHVFVQGFHWQKESEQRIGINSLTANILCGEHNNALSDLDKMARSFFAAMKLNESRQTPKSVNFKFSGHDLERWMLKALAGMAAAGSFRDSEGRAMPIDPNVDTPLLLTDPDAWKPPIGLFMLHRTGEAYQQRDNVEIAALARQPEMTVIGMIIRIRGMQFVLLLQPVSIIGLALEDAWYRPYALRHIHDHAVHEIKLVWASSLENYVVDIRVLAERPEEHLDVAGPLA